MGSLALALQHVCIRPVAASLSQTHSSCNPNSTVPNQHPGLVTPYSLLRFNLPLAHFPSWVMPLCQHGLGTHLLWAALHRALILRQSAPAPMPCIPPPSKWRLPPGLASEPSSRLLNPPSETGELPSLGALVPWRLQHIPKHPTKMDGLSWVLVQPRNWPTNSPLLVCSMCSDVDTILSAPIIRFALWVCLILSHLHYSLWSSLIPHNTFLWRTIFASHRFLPNH